MQLLKKAYLTKKQYKKAKKLKAFNANNYKAALIAWDCSIALYKKKIKNKCK